MSTAKLAATALCDKKREHNVTAASQPITNSNSKN